MRLWHYKLIPYLPKGQLVSQWRELNSIFRNRNRHILINYVYEEEKSVLWWYTHMILREFDKRGYKYNLNNSDGLSFHGYFDDMTGVVDIPCYFKEHDDFYLLVCITNLAEKFRRGQLDYSREQFNKMISALPPALQNLNLKEMLLQ